MFGFPSAGSRRYEKVFFPPPDLSGLQVMSVPQEQILRMVSDVIPEGNADIVFL